ncbi:hypothetical protein SZN_20472 [Streptomyces zinciresistens K42]|uniref:Uncharacterized protein n=1 Tax=Streptomyces zinciresistens K42 TaxID=700597 RepID=G2GF11_9ACTN|nr:hypothetical protein [Streptomyces zinciresistens]EGX57878.1 hypothetical protein SZN_20472 [Streptomyces zinciresistens K42]
MNNASTTQSSSDTREDAGHGRHRGQTSASDGETAPHGRHRRPAEESESAA